MILVMLLLLPIQSLNTEVQKLIHILCLMLVLPLKWVWALQAFMLRVLYQKS